MKLAPTAVVAQWIDEPGLRGFMLQANGELVELTRASRGSIWSPPKTVGSLQGCLESFEQLLTELAP